MTFCTSVLTSRQKLHDEIQIAFILKAVEHLNYPGAISLHQDISLGPDMSHLPQGDIQVRRDIISGSVWQRGDYLRLLNERCSKLFLRNVVKSTHSVFVNLGVELSG